MTEEIPDEDRLEKIEEDIAAARAEAKEAHVFDDVHEETFIETGASPDEDDTIVPPG